MLLGEQVVSKATQQGSNPCAGAEGSLTTLTRSASEEALDFVGTRTIGALRRGRALRLIVGGSELSPRLRFGLVWNCRRGSIEKVACLVSRFMLVRTQSSALLSVM